MSNKKPVWYTHRYTGTLLSTGPRGVGGNIAQYEMFNENRDWSILRIDEDAQELDRNAWAAGALWLGITHFHEDNDDVFSFMEAKVVTNRPYGYRDWEAATPDLAWWPASPFLREGGFRITDLVARNNGEAKPIISSENLRIIGLSGYTALHEMLKELYAAAKKAGRV